EKKPTAAGEYRPRLGTDGDVTAYSNRGWLKLRDGAKQSLIDETEALEKILDKVNDHRPPRGRGFDPR
ncbi:MAG: hypothetical protein AAF602_32890, partial [Myxococcota bacterium]